ncbi:caspase recruitment domain-containing protein 8 [Centroberyx affinis]|uniref:caspase recruitment domain-containing protein 8 n=1 Tax=Centroberyx affinis TaxID=166261 RepID=UPI003A5BDADD
MVVEMASCGAACHLEEGDGDIPAPDRKGNLTESDSSGSENAGTEESSEEEDDEEEDEDSEGCTEKNGGEGDVEELDAVDSNNEPTPGPEAEVFNGKDEMHFKLCCEKCKAIQQSHGNEQVTPRRISKGRLQVQLEGEGTYECSVTGLVFEVSEQVLVRYSVLSWSKFGMFLRDSWKFAGPIFNVDTVNKDASVLKSIQFPHSLCLADPENEMTFSVLHIKDNRPVIEPTVDHSGSHVKWNVSSLSPVGPIVQTSQSVEHHGVVLVYKELGIDTTNNNYSFRIYLATNNSSDIKDIGKEVRSSKRRYMKIEKPPTCKLDERRYRLMSEPEGEINPEDLPFTLAVTKLKGYFEAFFEQPPPFKLSLIETDSDQTVWSATIREGDCVDNTVEKPRKRTDSRKRSSSASEEELANKRPRWQDESDGVKAVLSQVQDISEKQLLLVAKRLGREWKQVAIYLDLSSRELEDIQAAEKDVTMQKLKMLVEWKSRRQPGEATVSHLWKSLEDLEDLPNEVHQTLKDMMDNRSAK